MNVIDFIRETAAFMCADRPELYTHQEAVEELSIAIDMLREGEDNIYECISFASYVLARICHEEDAEEFLFTRKISGAVLFSNGEEMQAYSLSDEFTGLPNIMDVDLGEED